MNKSHIARIKQSHVVYIIFDHSKTFESQAKSKSLPYLWIIIYSLKYFSVDHSCAHHLKPWLHKREIAWPETHLDFFPKKLLQKKPDYIFEVRNTHAFAHHKSFNLMEINFMCRINRFKTKYASRRDNLKWGLMSFHIANLHGTCMSS